MLLYEKCLLLLLLLLLPLPLYSSSNSQVAVIQTFSNFDSALVMDNWFCVDLKTVFQSHRTVCGVVWSGVVLYNHISQTGAMYQRLNVSYLRTIKIHTYTHRHIHAYQIVHIQTHSH